MIVTVILFQFIDSYSNTASIYYFSIHEIRTPSSLWGNHIFVASSFSCSCLMFKNSKGIASIHEDDEDGFTIAHQGSPSSLCRWRCIDLPVLISFSNLFFFFFFACLRHSWCDFIGFFFLPSLNIKLQKYFNWSLCLILFLFDKDIDLWTLIVSTDSLYCLRFQCFFLPSPNIKLQKYFNWSLCLRLFLFDKDIDLWTLIVSTDDLYLCLFVVQLQAYFSSVYG